MLIHGGSREIVSESRIVTAYRHQDWTNGSGCCA
jgi:hypothetical protein